MGIKVMDRQHFTYEQLEKIKDCLDGNIQLLAYLGRYGERMLITHIEDKAVVTIPRFFRGQIVELKFINHLAEAIKQSLKLKEINVVLNGEE
jgi:hypothetical protein